MARQNNDVFEKINKANGFNSRTKAIASGNHKLPMSHIIFNMTSATDCPSAKLGMCQCEEACYAKAEECRWKTVLNCKMQVQKWMETATTEQIIGLVEGYYKLYSLEYPIVALRFSESGDFTCQEYVNKMNQLAKYMREKHGVVTYGWTARTDLDFSNREFILNASSEDVKGYDRLFLATNQEEFDNLVLQKGEAKCFADCRRCHICSTINNIKKVYCRAHGPRAKKVKKRNG